MFYIEKKNELVNEFKKDKALFLNFLESNESDKYKHKKELTIDKLTKGNIIIKYPGYKTKKDKYGIKYDYQVNYKNRAISYPDIILDLYNKMTQCNQKEKSDFIKLLLSFSLYGTDTNIDYFDRLISKSFNPPEKTLINYVNKMFFTNGKNEPIKNPDNFINFSIEELRGLISWIAIQEDINYPMKKYSHTEGRRMAFKRYLEIMHLSNQSNSKDLLCEIIERSLVTNMLPDNLESVDKWLADKITNLDATKSKEMMLLLLSIYLKLNKNSSSTLKKQVYSIFNTKINHSNESLDELIKYYKKFN